MKKLFVLCLTILLLSFTLLATDVDLKSNLTFIFEPTATTEKPLIIIPFAEFDFSPTQEKTVEKKKESDLPIIFGIGVMLVTIFTIAQLH